MHCCEFCVSEYEVRPQVKNPRACQRPECQLERQRANEREWRKRHAGLYNSAYHAAKRVRRIRQIQAIAAVLQKCFQVGANLSGLVISGPEFSKVFEGFLYGLGMRQINKFWKVEDSGNFAPIAAVIDQI